MNQKETQEMRHMTAILKKLQAMQLKLYGDKSRVMSIEMGTYNHGIQVYVFTNVDHNVVGDDKVLHDFWFSVLNSPKENKQIVADIAALLK